MQTHSYGFREFCTNVLCTIERSNKDKNTYTATPTDACTCTHTSVKQRHHRQIDRWDDYICSDMAGLNFLCTWGCAVNCFFVLFKCPGCGSKDNSHRIINTHKRHTHSLSHTHKPSHTHIRAQRLLWTLPVYCTSYNWTTLWLTFLCPIWKGHGSDRLRPSYQSPGGGGRVGSVTESSCARSLKRAM